jgi:DNA-binding SARP family transcriptional activator
MRFVMLGQVGVIVDGMFHAVPGARQRTLLATLVLQGRQLVLKEQLYRELWGEQPPPTRENSLHAHISRLRKSLQGLGTRTEQAPALCAASQGYRLDVDHENVDALLLLKRAREARAIMTHDPKGALQLFKDALGLWQGPPLKDVAKGPFCRSTADRLDEEYAAALEDKLWLASQTERSAEVLRELRQVSAMYPWRERITEILMQVLCDAGRDAEAAHVYEDTRTRLAEQMGMEPSPRLRALWRQITDRIRVQRLHGHTALLKPRAL